MTPRETSSLLLRLVDEAERIVNRPALPPSVDAARVEALELEARTLIDKPVANGTPRIAGDYELLLCQVLRMIARARGNGERVMVLAQVAGVLIPAVRDNLATAIAIQRG